MPYFFARLGGSTAVPPDWIFEFSEKVFIPQDLPTTTYVFVRDASVRKSLHKPLSGPYKVKNQKDSYPTMLIKEKSKNISIEKLEPAFVE